MLDHVGLAVADLPRSRAFYEAALQPLGLTLLVALTREETGGYEGAGFGADGRPFFWIGIGDRPKGGAHVAFAAPTRAQVDAFYAAALGAGGRDNGGPGLRPHYDPDYYGAFVFDLDGNNVEAVCREPE